MGEYEEPKISATGVLKLTPLSGFPQMDPRPKKVSLPPGPECDYASCYCEENVYKLCSRLKSMDQVDLCWAVFISNAGRSVPLWHQKAGNGMVVVWDYHVILVYKDEEDFYKVYDLDTNLDF